MPGNLLIPLTFFCWPRSHEAMTPNGDQRYGRPSGRLYFMRKGDFDGYHHVADHHFAHIDFVWWWLLRARSLVVAKRAQGGR